MRKIKTLSQKEKNKSPGKKRQGKSVVHDGCSQKFYIKKKSVSSHITSNAVTGSKHDVTGFSATDGPGCAGTGPGSSIPYGREPVAAPGDRTSRSVRRYSRHRLHGPFMEVQKYRLRPVRADVPLSTCSRASPHCGQYNFSIPRASESFPPGYREYEIATRIANPPSHENRRRRCTTRWRIDTADNVLHKRARSRACVRAHVCVYVSGAHVSWRHASCVCARVHDVCTYDIRHARRARIQERR